ncbi:unnamed protein product [Cylicostephanus goldi]|uniref:Uncharacterized protein n=1 Tax=Cylicostephanus goldi TaxID=71465 RepID=A0A3P7MHW2_CYLGO|nr:unnamed protein product [Cylicostephanus goldi]
MEEYHTYMNQCDKARKVFHRWYSNRSGVEAELLQIIGQLDKWQKDATSEETLQITVQTRIDLVVKLWKEDENLKDQLITALIALQGAEAALLFRGKYGMPRLESLDDTEDSSTFAGIMALIHRDTFPRVVARLNRHTFMTVYVADVLEALTVSVVPSNLAEVMQRIANVDAYGSRLPCEVATQFRCLYHSVKFELKM